MESHLCAHSRALQARVSRQALLKLENDSSDEEPKQSERVSLADLKHRGKKKAIAPVIRTGAAIKRKGKLLANISSLTLLHSLFFMISWVGIGGGLQSRGTPLLGNISNSQLVVFDENRVESAGPSEPTLESWVAPPTSRAKENEQKPEKWCDVKV